MTRNAIAHCRRHQTTVRLTVEATCLRRTPCGCLVLAQVVKGEIDETRTCTAACRNAYNVKCRCACGGEDHGANHSDSTLLALAQ